MDEIKITRVDNRIDSEICAAIAMALSMEGVTPEEHDVETNVLTIHQADTAWNSHQRTIRHLPKRK